MVEPASWSCAWSPAAPGRCSFSRCSSVAPATGDAPVHSRSSRRSASGSSPRRSPSWSTSATTDGRAAESAALPVAAERHPGAPHGERDGAREPRATATTGRSTASSKHSRRRARTPSAWPASSTGSRRGRGPRLPPLLGHPNPVVRFYAVRLLSRYPALAELHVPACTSDSVAERPRRRARDAPGGGLRPLRSDTRSGFSTTRIRRCGRRHAARLRRSPAALSAAYLVPLLADTSWWVREAAREALVAAGEHATSSPSSRHSRAHDRRCGRGAALVLQDIGHVDALVGDDEVGRLERILRRGRSTASGSRGRARTERAPSSAMRARSRQRPPRELRDSASSRRPDVRCLPGVLWLMHWGLLVVGLVETRRRRREREVDDRRRSVRLPLRARRQHPRAGIQRERGAPGRGSLAARDRLPGVRGDRRQRRLERRHARAARHRVSTSSPSTRRHADVLDDRAGPRLLPLGHPTARLLVVDKVNGGQGGRAQRRPQPQPVSATSARVDADMVFARGPLARAMREIVARPGGSSG